MPLAQMTTGVPAGRTGRISSAIARRCCAGVAINTPSVRASTRARSPLAETEGSILISGRKSVFSWPSLMAATTSGSRAHNLTSRDGRVRTPASAVPHAPPPITDIRSIASRPLPLGR
jgi:hypothetical protein